MRYKKNSNFKRRNIVHSIPIGCMLALLLLSSICINPLGFSIDGSNDDKAYAAELTSSTNDTSAALIVDDGNIEDVILAESGVNYKSHNIKIKAANVESYTLQISASSNGTSELKLDGGNTTIPGAGGVVGGNMPTNTWGYAWGAENATEDSMTYYTLPAYGNVGTTISTGLLASDTPTNHTIDTSNKLSFAANFSDNIPSGHYTTSVLLSLAVEPKVLIGIWSTGINSGITDMQDMTSTICNQVSTPAINQTNVPTMRLIDSRDSTTYDIAKLKDGNCWMTQNLALINKDISSTDSDMTSGSFTIPTSRLSGFVEANQYTPKAYYDSQYGGYYNWYTATAGTGTSSVIDGKNATSSICPKGWQLPITIANNTPDKSYAKLLSDIPSNAEGSTIIRSIPYRFDYSGSVSNDSLENTGIVGDYWSSTSSGSAGAVFYFSMHSSNIINPSNSYYVRHLGYSVRCVAR